MRYYLTRRCPCLGLTKWPDTAFDDEIARFAFIDNRPIGFARFGIVNLAFPFIARRFETRQNIHAQDCPAAQRLVRIVDVLRAGTGWRVYEEFGQPAAYIFAAGIDFHDAVLALRDPSAGNGRSGLRR